MNKYLFIPQATQKIVPTYDGYRCITLCPFCNQEVRFNGKEIIKCPVCNNLISIGLLGK